MSQDIEGLCAELSALRAENERLAAALAAETELFGLAFERAALPMLVVSIEQGRYTHVNDAYTAFLGYSREEILNRDAYQLWLDTTHVDDFESERRLIQRVIDGELDGYRLERRYVRKDGSERWAEVTCSAVREARGRVRWMVLHIVDIQEQRMAAEATRELEARLLQSQKLEAVGRLVGGVAHDFNNRLLVIMGYAELLKRGTAGNPALESHAELVLSSSKRAADLTRQLLAYTRRQILRPRPCDLNSVVDGMRRMLERVIGEQIELVTVLGAKSAMLADPGQIEQVLMNLVLNARDAMPAGGRVTVETSDELIPYGCELDLAPGDYVALSVTDTGTGIPNAALPHIFEPFFTTKEVGKGTGLGLATVDGIVRQSGGSVSVHSAEGRGSTFTVHLPRAREQAADAPAPPLEPAARLQGVETILVVDDEDEVRRLLTDVLRIGAYHVLEARDGQHALEVVAAHGKPVELLVTDIVMPRLDGVALADRLHAHNPNLNVLFMSGYAERERMRELTPHEHVIAKPFLPTELYRRVNAILQQRPAVLAASINPPVPLSQREEPPARRHDGAPQAHEPGRG